MIFWTVLITMVVATAYGLLTLGYRLGEDAGYEKGLTDGEANERRKLMRLARKP